MIKNLEVQVLNKTIPKIQVGNRIRIGLKNPEQHIRRIQFFEGIVISKKNIHINTTITVRNSIHGIGVEYGFLLYSPIIESITIITAKKVRKSKLYYIRHLSRIYKKSV